MHDLDASTSLSRLNEADGKQIPGTFCVIETRKMPKLVRDHPNIN
jgi:hypothetical protein